MILVFQLNKEYMSGLTQEPFDTNDEGRTDRVKFRDAIASKNRSSESLYSTEFCCGTLTCLVGQVRTEKVRI